jgi:DtxR family Mn-dependent transcriptional regulator
VRTLDLTWDQVHEEAENMEHAVSDTLIERIDDFLGRPETDPHGDPIPSADGLMRGKKVQAVPLSTCPPPSRIKIVRVLNQQPEFLRFLTELGLEPGATATVEQNSIEGGLISAKVGKKRVSLGHSAAEQLLVEPIR